MKKYEIQKLLYNDISKVELPPIDKRVIQAINERKSKIFNGKEQKKQ